MKRKVWILVQHLLPKRNSQSWERNRKALAYEPLNISVTLRGRCWLTDKLSVSSEPRHVGRIRKHCLDAGTSSVSSVFIARDDLRSNAQNRHPFHHLPCRACDQQPRSGFRRDGPFKNSQQSPPSAIQRRRQFASAT